VLETFINILDTVRNFLGLAAKILSGCRMNVLFNRTAVAKRGMSLQSLHRLIRPGNLGTAATTNVIKSVISQQSVSGASESIIVMRKLRFSFPLIPPPEEEEKKFGRDQTMRSIFLAPRQFVDRHFVSIHPNLKLTLPTSTQSSLDYH
jgi:hypothetical protein